MEIYRLIRLITQWLESWRALLAARGHPENNTKTGIVVFLDPLDRPMYSLGMTHKSLFINLARSKIITLIFAFIFKTNLVYASSTIGVDDNKQRQYFADIRQIDPTIIVDLKYASNDNFLKQPVSGYNHLEALLTFEAAKALRAVQEYLVMRGFCLVVYDAYHPVKSYRAIEAWASSEESNEDKSVKSFYYPNIDKTALITDGYISNKLDHTRGSTVDVTIISFRQKLNKPYSIKKLSYKKNLSIIYRDDGTLNMGSSYDTFDPISMHDNNLISEEARENRALLKEAMESHGFIANKKLWWQYSLAREPFLDTKFDFDL